MLMISLSSTQVPSSTPDVPPLKRPVALTRLNATSAHAVMSLMAQARVPGGIISIREKCSKERTHQFSLPETTLQRGLDYVSGIDKSRGWLHRGGVIIVGFALLERTILKTAITDVDIDPNDSLSLATQRLLDSAEVREQIRESGLIQMNSPLGFSAVAKAGETPPNQRPRPQQMHLHDTTLEAALNALASMKGPAVWHYEQVVCGDKLSFRLGWAVSPR